MALNKPVANPAVSEDHRTRLTIIATPLDEAPSIRVERESVPRDAAGEITIPGPSPLAGIERSFPDIIGSKSVSVTLHDGRSVDVSVEMIALALPQFFDRWAQEDEGRAAEIASQQEAAKVRLAEVMAAAAQNHKG